MLSSILCYGGVFFVVNSGHKGRIRVCKNDTISVFILTNYTAIANSAFSALGY